MSNLENKPAKGRLHWLIPVLEIVVVILFLAIGFGGIMEAFVKVSPNGFFEIHIDRDDANCFLLNNGDEVEIEKIK